MKCLPVHPLRLNPSTSSLPLLSSQGSMGGGVGVIKQCSQGMAAKQKAENKAADRQQAEKENGTHKVALEKSRQR